MRPGDAWCQLEQKNGQAAGAQLHRWPAILPAPSNTRTESNWHAALSHAQCRVSPSASADRIVYPKSSPEYFALFAEEAAELGVRLLGGCCGTTPEHIRAMAVAVKKLQPAKIGSRRKTGQRRRGARTPGTHETGIKTRARAGEQALEKIANAGIRGVSRN